MIKVIYTSYTNTKDGLVLRNNWSENFTNKDYLLDALTKYQIYLDPEIIGISTISPILEGKMELPNVIIHCRIVVI